MQKVLDVMTKLHPPYAEGMLMSLCPNLTVTEAALRANNIKELCPNWTITEAALRANNIKELCHNWTVTEAALRANNKKDWKTIEQHEY